MEVSVRRYTEENDTKIDLFMRAWTEILSIGQIGINRLNQKKYRKEVCRHLRVFGLEEKPGSPESALVEAWRQFTVDYMNTCVESRMFSKAVMGFVKWDDKTLLDKIRRDIDAGAKEIPEKLGLGEMAAPLHETMAATCEELIQKEQQNKKTEGRF